MTGGLHVGDLAPTGRELLGHDPHELVGHVDQGQFYRFVGFTVHLPSQDLGLRNAQLVPLSAHHFNQNGKLELTSAKHLEGLWRREVYLDRDVIEQFLFKTVAQVARRYVFTIVAGKR